MASFVLLVNTLRTLVRKGLLERVEAIEMVDEARRQLDQLIAANRTDRAVMLERELLDYEAIFRDIDARAAEDLLRPLRDALARILADGPRPLHLYTPVLHPLHPTPTTSTARSPGSSKPTPTYSPQAHP